MKKNTLKALPYGNCQVQNLDGHHIFNCGPKKSKWYLSRGLAEVIQDYPQIIKLNFTLNGEGHRGDPYFLQHRENICVVCGTTERLTKHHILPRCYRSYLNESIKNYNSYDILPLCYECHETYETHANVYKRELFAALNIKKEKAMVISPEIRKVRSTAFALLNYNSIPPERREVLLDYIRKYYGKDNISDEDLRLAADLEKNVRIEYRTESEIVVDNIVDVEAFVIGWRKHFVTHTNPRYMPQHWDAERPLKKFDINKNIL